jgi:ribosomal protein L18
MKLSELKTEITSILRERSINEATYKFGKVEYTSKKLTPTDILDLAYAYIKTPIGKIIGRSFDEQLLVARDIGKLIGRRPEFPNQKNGKPAMMHVLLKNKLVTLDEYKKLFKALIERHTHVVNKYLKKSSPGKRTQAKNTGEDAAERAARRDMSVSYESIGEAINERYGSFIKAKNLTDIVALSKKKKSAVFYVTDDNNSRIGTFYLKNGKFAKATSGNANYDLQNSNTKLKDRSDVIYKYKIDESVVNEMAMGFDTMTGLFYLKGVPFTKERIKEVILFMKSSKPKTSSNQFEMTSALIIKDKVNKGEVTIDSKNLKTLIEAFKRYKNLASDKDFN